MGKRGRGDGGTQGLCHGLREQLLIRVQADLVAVVFWVQGKGALDDPLEQGRKLLMGRSWEWLEAEEITSCR